LTLDLQFPYSHAISVLLPFERVTARALIVRRKDGAILGTRHHEGAMYALPGGGLEDKEDSAIAIIRELNEENIILQGMDMKWPERIALDYYGPYQELAIWHLFTVENAIAGVSENIETRWIQQDEDVWYPNMLEKIILHLKTHVPMLILSS
jgi:hypothetical protein